MTHQHLDARSSFDPVADAYDQWYETADGRAIFEAEAACLSRVGGSLSGRWLEVGVGTGRFAARLGIGEGVDPSKRMLEIALGRGIRVIAACAEELPFAGGSFDGLLLALTLCFVADPEQALRECHRVLRKNGRLLVGVTPADSPWGRAYVRAASEGHPVYAMARFSASREAVPLSETAGFRLVEAASTLLMPHRFATLRAWCLFPRRSDRQVPGARPRPHGPVGRALPGGGGDRRRHPELLHRHVPRPRRTQSVGGPTERVSAQQAEHV